VVLEDGIVEFKQFFTILLMLEQIHQQQMSHLWELLFKKMF